MQPKFVLFSKEMKAIHEVEITIFFDVIPLNNAVIFLLQDDAILLCLEPIKDLFFTIWFMF